MPRLVLKPKPPYEPGQTDDDYWLRNEYEVIESDKDEKFFGHRVVNLFSNEETKKKVKSGFFAFSNKVKAAFKDKDEEANPLIQDKEDTPFASESNHEYGDEV